MLKGNVEIIQSLTALAVAHCTSLQQLRIHKNMCDLWGYRKLRDYYTEHYADILAQLDKIILRLLQHEHAVDLQHLGKLNLGQTVEEILVSDREMALATKDSASHLFVSLNRDLSSKRLIEEIFILEDSRVLFFDRQLELIRQLGTSGYLSALL